MVNRFPFFFLFFFVILFDPAHGRPTGIFFFVASLEQWLYFISLNKTNLKQKQNKKTTNTNKNKFKTTKPIETTNLKQRKNENEHWKANKQKQQKQNIAKLVSLISYSVPESLTRDSECEYKVSIWHGPALAPLWLYKPCARNVREYTQSQRPAVSVQQTVRRVLGCDCVTEEWVPVVSNQLVTRLVRVFQCCRLCHGPVSVVSNW